MIFSQESTDPRNLHCLCLRSWLLIWSHLFIHSCGANIIFIISLPSLPNFSPPHRSLLIFSPYLLSPLPVGADYNWLDLNIERDNTRWRSSVTFVAKKRPRCFAPLTRQPFVTLVTTVSIMPTSLLQSISVFPFSILPQKTSPSVISARFFSRFGSLIIHFLINLSGVNWFLVYFS